LFDPYGLRLEWRAMEMAGRSRAIDMFLNFPVMDMNRNAIWRNPGAVAQEGIDRMNSFLGDKRLTLSIRKVTCSVHQTS
jgi:hypothetical protein